MSPREQRKTRKAWRINTQNYKMRKEAAVRADVRRQENTPPPSDDEPPSTKTIFMHNADERLENAFPTEISKKGIGKTNK